MLIRQRKTIGRIVAIGLTVMVVTVVTPGVRGGLGTRHVDPAQVVPLQQIAAERRDEVAEVIRDHTFHRQGEADTFQCSPGLYLSLLNEPTVPLALWKDLSESPVQLQKVSPNRYEGTDGSGSTAAWEFVFRSPKLHVLLAYFNYVSPHANAKVDARIVLVVNTTYYRDSKKEPWIQHNVDAYVKVDSKGWKTIARTVRPVVERILEDQVKEAGYFISLMSKLVQTYPNWASEVVSAHPAIDAASKQRFCTVVVQTRRPGASTGRPVVMKQPDETADTRRR
jgi:hypothetical protein